MKETKRIKDVYEKRKKDSRVINANNSIIYSNYISIERQAIYTQILKNIFKELSLVKLIEIGAGNGANLLFFKQLGIVDTNIWGNELLEDRGETLKENLPNINIHVGDALELEYKDKFDIVFQSTVFTSILNQDFKQQLANKMFEMTKKGGIILWYDFKYNNPNNKNVKGINKKEINKLFKAAKSIEYYNVTLAPPVGRRVGKLYIIL